MHDCLIVHDYWQSSAGFLHVIWHGSQLTECAVPNLPFLQMSYGNHSKHFPFFFLKESLKGKAVIQFNDEMSSWALISTYACISILSVLVAPHLQFLEQTPNQESPHREKSTVATWANHHKGLWAQALTACAQARSCHLPSTIPLQAKPAFQVPLHYSIIRQWKQIPRELLLVYSASQVTKVTGLGRHPQPPSCNGVKKVHSLGRRGQWQSHSPHCSISSRAFLASWMQVRKHEWVHTYSTTMNECNLTGLAARRVHHPHQT